MTARAHVLLGVTGGIAAFKAADLASKLRQDGYRVRPVLTTGAQQFVTPLTFAALSGRHCYVDDDRFQRDGGVLHVRLAQADLAVIAPATADFLAHLRAGMADNLLLMTLLAMEPAAVLLAPAMESNMWSNPATRANIAWLKEAGYGIIEPARGHLASGASGLGRLPEVAQLREHIAAALTPKSLGGRRVVISGGPTVEPIDAVRYLSNPSSGKMAVALARIALRRGADVDLVVGPLMTEPPEGARVTHVRTALEMQAAMREKARAASVVVMAAAVADFRPQAAAAQDKRAKADTPRTIELTENPDIVAELARTRSPGQVVVAFAAETGELERKACRKRQRKGVDVLVANDVTDADAVFGADYNEVLVVTAEGVVRVPRMAKLEVAQKVWDTVEGLLS